MKFERGHGRRKEPKRGPRPFPSPDAEAGFYAFILHAKDLTSDSIEIYLCADLFLVPRFREIDHHPHHDDDAYSCFIKTAMFFRK
jgi:hypothetical protein